MPASTSIRSSSERKRWQAAQRAMGGRHVLIKRSYTLSLKRNSRRRHARPFEGAAGITRRGSLTPDRETAATAGHPGGRAGALAGRRSGPDRAALGEYPELLYDRL